MFALCSSVGPSLDLLFTIRSTVELSVDFLFDLRSSVSRTPIQDYELMSSPVTRSSVVDPEIVPEVNRTAPKTQDPVSLHDCDPTLPESEFNHLYRYIVTNHGYHSWLKVLLKCYWTSTQMILPCLRAQQNYPNVLRLKMLLSNFIFVTESLLIWWWTSWKEFAIRTFANPLFSASLYSLFDGEFSKRSCLIAGEWKWWPSQFVWFLDMVANRCRTS